MSEYL